MILPSALPEMRTSSDSSSEPEDSVEVSAGAEVGSERGSRVTRRHLTKSLCPSSRLPGDFVARFHDQILLSQQPAKSVLGSVAGSREGEKDVGDSARLVTGAEGPRRMHVVLPVYLRYAISSECFKNDFHGK